LTPCAEPPPMLPDSEIRARRLVPHPWRLERVEHGGRKLVVSVAGKLSAAGVQVTETADEVSVTVYVRLTPPGSLIRHIIVLCPSCWASRWEKDGWSTGPVRHSAVLGVKHCGLFVAGAVRPGIGKHAWWPHLARSAAQVRQTGAAASAVCARHTCAIRQGDSQAAAVTQAHWGRRHRRQRPA
jgi:hypothetical protein